MAQVSEGLHHHLLDTIYSTVLEPDGWDLVLRDLAAATGSIAGGLTIENPETGRGYPVTFFGFDPDHVTNTFDHFLPQNPLHAISERMQTGAILTNEMAVPMETFLRSDFYNGWARPQGLCAPVTVVLHRSVDIYTPLTLVRPDGKGDIDGEQFALLASLAPHLVRALKIGLKFRDLDARSIGLGSALSHLSSAVFLLDRCKRITFTNAAAEHMIGLGDIIRVEKNGILAAQERLSDQALNTALDGVLSGAVNGADARLWSLNQGPVAATIIGVPGKQAFLLPSEGQPACLVLIRTTPPTMHDALARQAGLLFGLTPAEEQFVAALLPGTGLTQVALQLGVGRETVRTHLRNVFSKTGTHKQAELIMLIGGLVPSIPSGRDGV